MIESLKSYEETKPSGSSWIGEVPAHWELRKIKHLTRLINGIAFKPSDWKPAGVPIIRIQNLNGSQAFNFTDRQDLPTELLIERGDLVFSWSGNKGTSFGPFQWDSETPGYLNQHIFKLIDFKISKRYFYYLLRSATKHIEDQAGGIIGLVHVTKSELGGTLIPVAPEKEAIAISKFLDYADLKINQAIEAKRKTIALLNEQKQAIVHQAVTRGLDPSVPLKPSGLPWLGDIPAHWEMTPNRALLRRRKVLVGDRHLDYQLLSLTKRGVIVRDLTNMTGKFSADMGTSQEVRPGDMVFCLFDVPETPRTVGLARVGGMITGAYTIFVPSERANSSYLELFYMAMDDRKLLSPLYSGLRNTIPAQTLLGTKSPQPPRDEQDDIVEFVGDECRRLELAASKLERECELLTEYRTRLTSDVVTGKLDVREAAKSLPDLDEATPAALDFSPDELDNELEAAGAA